LLEEGQWYLGTVTGNGEDNTAYVTFDEQAFATHLMSMHFLWPAKVVEMLDEFETVWLKSEPEDQPGGEPERQPECEPEDPASYVSGPTLSLKDMYAPCTCEQIWFGSGWRCPHVGDSEVARSLVLIMIELKREFKLSSIAIKAYCTAGYDRAEANIEALQKRIFDLQFLLNDADVCDRAWEAALDRKVEVCVYGEDSEALLLRTSVPIGTTVGALKAEIQDSYDFAYRLQQFSCCVGDRERAILMRDEDHIGQWGRSNSELLNVWLCNMGP